MERCNTASATGARCYTEMSDEEPKRKAGRPIGAKNKQTLDVKELAQDYTAEAIEKLATIMRTSTNEGAQVSAIKELLDRGHGKSKQVIDATVREAEVSGEPELSESEWMSQHGHA